MATWLKQLRLVGVVVFLLLTSPPYSNVGFVQPDQTRPTWFNSILPTETIKGQAIGRAAGVGSVTNDGAAQYKIPHWVPPGRSGIQPNLALVYNSRNGIWNHTFAWLAFASGARAAAGRVVKCRLVQSINHAYS